MHFYFLTRGINQQTEIFKKFMETQMFPWNRKNLETGEIETFNVQGSLRPVMLWEYVFPEENLKDVMKMLNLTNGNIGINDNKIVNKAKLATLRRALGAKPIPEDALEDINPGEPKRFIETRGVSIHPIGIKKDKRKECPEWGYEQEML